MASQVILYDLPSQRGIAWSLNPWKSDSGLIYFIESMLTLLARMILNYKGIDYKVNEQSRTLTQVSNTLQTEWIEYPDIAPKFKELYVWKVRILDETNTDQRYPTKP
jgi:hypothetical protein